MSLVGLTLLRNSRVAFHLDLICHPVSYGWLARTSEYFSVSANDVHCTREIHVDFWLRSSERTTDHLGGFEPFGDGSAWFCGLTGCGTSKMVRLGFQTNNLSLEASADLMPISHLNDDIQLWMINVFQVNPYKFGRWFLILKFLLSYRQTTLKCLSTQEGLIMKIDLLWMKN